MEQYLASANLVSSFQNAYGPILEYNKSILPRLLGFSNTFSIHSLESSSYSLTEFKLEDEDDDDEDEDDEDEDEDDG